MKIILKYVAYFVSIFLITFFIMFLSARCGLAIEQVILIGALSILLCLLMAWETRDVDTFVQD
ncbi:hypothetical protein [Bacillus massiliigorillae]|uniref:hypothetical protein n=1 Tax=Bacillus massiliigorillae TaxID=1243664 RepID=UPI00039FF2E7|nr:hypothetical protein [Bacillus massiliigorillae]